MGKLVAALVADCPQIQWWKSRCFKHQAHLIAHGNLSLIDAFLVRIEKSFKYYSSLCKIANVRRDKAKDIFAARVALLQAKDRTWPWVNIVGQRV
jgi:hypothetical protein